MVDCLGACCNALKSHFVKVTLSTVKFHLQLIRIRMSSLNCTNVKNSITLTWKQIINIFAEEVKTGLKFEESTRILDCTVMEKYLYSILH